MDWHHHHAQECFSKRMTLYAEKLGVALRSYGYLVPKPVGKLPLAWESSVLTRG